MIVYRPFLLGVIIIYLFKNLPISTSSTQSQYGKLLFQFGKCVKRIDCNPNGHCSCQDLSVNMAIIDCFVPVATFKSEWRQRSGSLEDNFKHISTRIRKRMKELCNNNGYYESSILHNYGVEVQALSAFFVSEVLNKP